MGIKRILVVDDSATERHMLKDLLTKAGYEVFSSENGEDAIAKARKLKPDLILMDVVMPGLNGFQATRAISRDPETNAIPVIMCTSKSQKRTRSGAFAKAPAITSSSPSIARRFSRRSRR